MGLKFSDVVCLSWSNIIEHKQRSVIIVLMISLLFGMIMGFSFIAAGIEETTIMASAGQTGGEVYVEAKYGSWVDNNVLDFIGSPEEISRISLEPVLDDKDDEKIRERVSEYDGKVIGYYWYYQLDYLYHVIDKSAVEQFIDTDLWQSLPSDKMPTIMPEGVEASTKYGKLREKNRRNFVSGWQYSKYGSRKADSCQV